MFTVTTPTYVSRFAKKTEAHVRVYQKNVNGGGGGGRRPQHAGGERDTNTHAHMAWQLHVAATLGLAWLLVLQ